MSLKRFIAICLLGAVIGIVVVAGGSFLWIGHKMREDLRHQAELNAAAKPLVDAAVTQKLKVGDTLEHAKKVFKDAGLAYSVESTLNPGAQLNSFYPTGQGCGIRVRLDIDANGNISKIDIRESITGL